MKLATVNCLIRAKTPIVTDALRVELLKENEGLDYSYYCLLKESLNYIENVLLCSSWSGVRLYDIDSLNKLYNTVNRVR